MSRSYRKPYLKDRTGRQHRDFRRLVRSGEKQDLRNNSYKGLISPYILDVLEESEFRNRKVIQNDYDYNDFKIYRPSNNKYKRK